MVHQEPDESPTGQLAYVAADAYALAFKDHAEAFLFYLNGKPGRTVAEARAMADVEVDLVRAEVNWLLALEAYRRATQPA